MARELLRWRSAANIPPLVVSREFSVAEMDALDRYPGRIRVQEPPQIPGEVFDYLREVQDAMYAYTGVTGAIMPSEGKKGARTGVGAGRDAVVDVPKVAERIGKKIREAK